MGDHDHDVPQTLSPAATVEAARNDAVAVWWQLTTFVEVRGAEAVSFLDGLATQNIAAIEPGSARHALFLTTKARIVAPTLAYRVDDQTVLLELDPALANELVAHLRKYRLRAKAEIEPGDLGTVSVVGPRQPQLAMDAGWYDAPTYGAPARTFVGSRDAATALVNDELPHAGVGLADPEALDSLRIEVGTPSLSDLLVGSMPAEVGGVELAVALDKGCYLGQEPVARLHYRGRANRTLRQVALSHELPGDYGADAAYTGDDYLALESPEGKRVGTLTSWARSPHAGLVGLAVLRREVADGAPLRLTGSDVQLTAGPVREAAPAAVE